MPPKQPTQLEAPVAAWGVPSMQLMHEEAPLACAEAPAEAQAPPKQPAQLEAPVAAWGVPSMQLMHEVAPFES